MNTLSTTSETEQVDTPITEEIPPLFVTSIEKLVLLFVGTLGLYTLYWGYKQWSTQRKSLGKTAWPLWRTLFLVFYIHSLCNLITSRLAERKLSAWNYSVIAAAFVTLKLTEWVLATPDLLREPLKYFAQALVFEGALLLLLVIMQRHANLASEDPKGVANSTISFANAVCLILFSPAWLLLAAGL